MLVEEPSVDALARANKIVERLVAAPPMLVGDATIEARAKAVLDDAPYRRYLELAAVLAPKTASVAEDLAYLDQR